MNINIIPIPQKIIMPEFPTHFAFGKSITIKSNDLSNFKIKLSVNLLEKELKNILGVDIHNFDKENNSQIKLELVDTFPNKYSIPNNFEDEAYILEVEKDLVIIKATTPKGIYYGVQSFLQIANDNNGILQNCKIIDYPNMKIRGISDDFSRGQVSSMENFKRIIDFISSYKMNTYMPYMEDVIQFDNYPEIGVGRGALSKNEIREIIEYADEHFVEVIPIFQTLGHFENILSQPKFIKYADFPGGASLDITNEETYNFLETMLLEVFELFPSKYFHMGADESYDIGLGKSRAIVEETDLATVHANHYKRVYDICKKNNKEVMMYGDIILNYPNILEQIPKDITIVDWHYHPKFNYPSTKTFKEAGFNYIVSPSVWNFNSAFPENFYAIPNIKTFTEDGINNNSIGMINSSWGDFGAETFREYNLYGYAWSAQCAWNISESDITNFNKSFFNHFFDTEERGLEIIYNNLSDPIKQLLGNDLWRHPLLDERKADWRQLKIPNASKYSWMKTKNNHLELLNELKNKVTKNKDHLELLEFTLKLKNWDLLKQETHVLLQNILDSNNVDIELTLNLLDKNISQLTKLRNEFSILWKKYNTVDNLWMIENKFNRLIAYFKETKTNLKKNNLESPLIKSEWIYYPKKEDEFISKVDFLAELRIDDEIESAQIQIVGDTFAKLLINGKIVDSVFTKRSGSLWIEQQRIKLIDITELLKLGKNTITVEAKNFYTSKTPGINIIAEIITKSGTINFMSDENWKVKNDILEEWQPVEMKENSLEIIAPNFSTKRKSWIER
ncbi:MAG: family 20 glycosylhydrolase [Ignavibacteriae bacterium]|nr:family 20 glycosylhydrolase [Ignavibacteriota bacterium]